MPFPRAFALLLGCLLTGAAPCAQEQQPSAAEQQAIEAENELHRVIADAGNDRAALIRNLEDYLRRFPEAPRRLQVFRALVEAALQLNDRARAAEYAERIIALEPDDSSMLLLAADLLEQAGDANSLTRAVGYVTRVLDRVEKSPEMRADAPLSEESRSEARKLLMTVYLIRGRLQMLNRDYDAAAADLEASYATLPTPAAAVHLGEIAEIRGRHDEAIRRYTYAFVMPEAYGLGVDRGEVRRKLGNAWRRVHGSEAGLGEHVLAAYDAAAQPSPAGAGDGPPNNAAQTLHEFTLRRLGGSTLGLAELRGKVAVLHFWAPWCAPSREVQRLMEGVAGSFVGRDVVFLAVTTDTDAERAAAWAEREKLRGAALFADGLDRFLGVDVLPAVLVLDRNGDVLYRNDASDLANFTADLTNAVRAALAN